MCIRPVIGARIRIPLTDIENPQAYVSAEWQDAGGIPCDIKWSPMFQRYFAAGFRVWSAATDPCASEFEQSPILTWSEADIPPEVPPSFPATNQFDTACRTRATGIQSPTGS